MEGQEKWSGLNAIGREDEKEERTWRMNQLHSFIQLIEKGEHHDQDGKAERAFSTPSSFENTEPLK